MKVDKKKIKKVAVIGLSSLGDNLLLTPAILNIVAYLEGAQFYAFVPEKYAEIFLGIPRFVQVIPYEREIDGRMYLIRHLRRMKFDMVIDFKCTLVPWLSGARYKPTFFFQEFFAPKHGLHEARRNLLFIKQEFHIETKEFPLYFPVKDDDRQWVEAFLKSNSATGEIVVFAIGANWDKKRWPIEKFITLAERLSQHRKGSFFIVGNREDEKELAKIFLSKSRVRAFDMVGKTTIGKVAALLKYASLLVSNDSGILHLASAMGTPTVAIYGPGGWTRYGPYGNNHRVVHLDLPCIPCNKSYCKFGDFRCIKGIPVKMVEEACLEIWHQGTTEQIS